MAAAPQRLGKYDLVARIAKGGMAEIYLARQRGMVGFSRLVVIKRILPHLAEEPQFVRMFLEEARLAALVNHPNVVQIFDVDQFEGHYYIAMEYINGPPVSTVVRKLRRQRRGMPYAVAAEIVAQSCDGLHAAHELQDEAGSPLRLVHRDVSPHNLMIAEGGVVKLVDFGIAKAQGSAVQTRTGNIKGKYPYMSPEQCRGDQLDRRTDLFSLGASFFELVTGRRLFQRQTELMTLKAITEERIPLAREVQGDVPEEISAVICRTMERLPEARYATAAELGQAVRAALAGLATPSSAATLAAYLKAEHGELLLTRAEALQRATQLPAGASVAVVDGFGSSSASAPEGTGSGTHPQAPLIPTLHHRRRSRRRALIAAVLAVLLAVTAGLVVRALRGPSRPAGPPLFLGVPPTFPEGVAQSELVAFRSYLERRVGRRFEVVVPKSYRAVRAALLAGGIHLANLPPLEYLLSHRADKRVQALVTNLYEGAPTYQALLVTRDDSRIATLEDLQGKRFCYVDEESTSGYLLPRQFLRRLHLNPDKIFKSTRFSGNHIAVLKDIVAGVCDAGAVYSGAMINAHSHGVAASRIRMVTSVGQLPYDLFCVGPHTPPELVEPLRRALLEMQPRRDLGREIVGPNFRISGFIAPQLKDFDVVEEAARSEGLMK